MSNNELGNYFREVLASYQSAANEFNTVDQIPRFKHLISGQKGLIPNYFKTESKLINYTVRGSIGQGNITPFPWICVFDNDITKSAQKGYYLVYLFKEDMSGFYLSLNQGWEQYNRSYTNSKNGLKKILENALTARSVLRTVNNLTTGPLSIRTDSNRIRERGYESGNIAAIYYDGYSIPEDDILISDLNTMVGVYRELKGIIGDDILQIENFKHLLNIEIDELDYQEKSNKVSDVTIPYGPKKKKTIKTSNAEKSIIQRDPNIASNALKNANYKCEIDSRHTTFINRKSGNNFVEAHHLIPMSYYEDFEFDIDIPENIIALCPNCHRAIHHGLTEEIQIKLRKFYEVRITNLNKRGIDISFKKLKQLYEIF